ncbi:hypothetical protein EW145_g3508 [Phellinidium pouzarii]|uniref:Fungal lipase-type domain-containing protein n=1 Tax=Phellinidium pouzarii TaxID=167371 RepID=A0A4S4LC58_9AGAM|nr:hypothetical protein EW145_g3508 [Phellinidium pouzarii]
MRFIISALVIATTGFAAPAFVEKRSISQSLMDQFTRYVQFASGAYQLFCPAPLGTTLITQFSDKPTNTQGYITRDDDRKEIIVAYRGSIQLQDFVTDLDFILVDYSSAGVTNTNNVQVHQGFLTAFNSVTETVLSTVSDQLDAFPGYSLISVGHSLGAALASLGGVSLAANFPGIPLTVFTYGQPRTGNPSYASLAEDLIGVDNIFRTVETYDGVPTIPPISFGYEHHIFCNSATQYWVFQDPNTNPNNVKQCVGREDPTCSDSIPSLGIDDAHLRYFGQSPGDLVVTTSEVVIDDADARAPRPGHEWIITLSEGIWPVIGCWDLKQVKNGSPVRVGEWFCRGATIENVVVNSDAASNACLIISVVQNSRQRLEMQSIRPTSDTRQVIFETIKTIHTNYKPIYLNGDILAISNEHSETHILNWRTGHYAILQNTEETEDETVHDKCLQVLFAQSSILVVRARSIDLFPMVDLSPPDEEVHPVKPLETCSFGWIDGIAVAPLSEPTDYPYSPISILIRAESGDPWASDIHSLNKYVLYPNSTFVPSASRTAPSDDISSGFGIEQAPSSKASSLPLPASEGLPVTSCGSPYIFPPVLTTRIPSTRGFLRCPTLVLGAAGSSIWIHPRQRQRSVGMLESSSAQTLCAAVFHGPFTVDKESPAGPAEERIEEVETLHLYSGLSSGPATWTALDYVEARGCIALGAADGSVTVLYMA